MRYRPAEVPGATCFFMLNATDCKGQVLLDHVLAGSR